MWTLAPDWIKHTLRRRYANLTVSLPAVPPRQSIGVLNVSTTRRCCRRVLKSAKNNTWRLYISAITNGTNTKWTHGNSSKLTRKFLHEAMPRESSRHIMTVAPGDNTEEIQASSLGTCAFQPTPLRFQNAGKQYPGTVFSSVTDGLDQPHTEDEHTIGTPGVFPHISVCVTVIWKHRQGQR